MHLMVYAPYSEPFRITHGAKANLVIWIDNVVGFRTSEATDSLC